MFLMSGAFVMFLSLALGYILCVVAKKQEGTLKTIGYTFGISILVLSLLYGLSESLAKASGMGKSGCMSYGHHGHPMKGLK